MSRVGKDQNPDTIFFFFGFDAFLFVLYQAR